jgi:hypothetical protein
MRTDWDAVIEIDDVLIGQADAPLDTAWPMVSGSVVPMRGLGACDAGRRREWPSQPHFKIAFRQTATLLLRHGDLFANKKEKHMRKYKRKRGIDLICPKHGAEAMRIDELGPTEKHSFEVTCRKRCPHHEYASDKQVEGILRAYPDCDAREYQQSAYDSLFERPK